MKHKIGISRSYSLPIPTFWTGIARLIDVGGAINRDLIRRLEEQSDADAIRSDWEAVGESMQWAMRQYGKEMNEKIVREQ